MDQCFAFSLEAHWTCTDEVKNSEAKRNTCFDESARFDRLLDARWVRGGQGVRGVSLTTIVDPVDTSATSINDDRTTPKAAESFGNNNTNEGDDEDIASEDDDMVGTEGSINDFISAGRE